MANTVTITLDPTYLNVSNNPMVFVLNSTNIDEFQYQYVLDVRTWPDNTLRTRIKQFPNPEGVGIFDVSHVVDDYITYNPNNFKIEQIESPLGDEYQRYRILAGEEYGTSPSSSVTLYDGTGSIGAPEVTGPNASGDGIYSAWGGTLDMTLSSSGSGGGWNFGDYFDVSTGQYILSSLQTNYSGPSEFNHKIGRNDYSVMPVLDTQNSITGQSTTISLYDSNNSLVATNTLGRTRANQYINYIPVGTQNLIDGGYFTQAQINQTAWYRVQNVASNNFTKSFTIQDCSSNYERRNFLFINKWGLWESYGMNTPLRQSTTITRDEIKKPRIPWSSNTGRNSFSQRGYDTYNQSQEDRFTITTPYLRDDEAKFVTELIESPQVYLQYNTLDMGLGVSVSNTFVPIQITNSAYTHKTSRLQKITQYDIEYKLANSRPNR